MWYNICHKSRRGENVKVGYENMALIKCPECGKDISDRAPSCIHCGCPISFAAPQNGKIIIKAQTNPIDFTVHQLTFDIYTTQGKKLCTIEPGRVLTVEIDRDTEVFAIPTYGLEFAKNKRKYRSDEKKRYNR